MRTEVSNIEKYVSELISEFSGEKVFSREKLKVFYKAHEKDLKDSSFNWTIYHLCEDKVVQRLGYNMFQLYNDKAVRNLYNPTPSEDLLRISDFVTAKFPLLTFSIWEFWMLNEFLNHQFERNAIVIDVEKFFEESVFEAIKTEFDLPVLYKPTQRDLDLYSGHVTALIFPLTSEAPKSNREKTIAPLEKILVDLFSNKTLQSVISFGEYPNIFEGAFSKYLIDEKAMFRYARRRKTNEDILKFIHSNTSIHLLTEASYD